MGLAIIKVKSHVSNPMEEVLEKEKDERETEELGTNIPKPNHVTDKAMKPLRTQLFSHRITKAKGITPIKINSIESGTNIPKPNPVTDKAKKPLTTQLFSHMLTKS